MFNICLTKMVGLVLDFLYLVLSTLIHPEVVRRHAHLLQYAPQETPVDPVIRLGLITADNKARNLLTIAVVDGVDGEARRC